MSQTFALTQSEVRVLGSLIEKEITTPDYYPLSLNALQNACNQKSSRDPIMDLGEEDIRAALDGLQQVRLAGPASGADRRVPKFEHRLQEVFNLNRRETAVLCVLLLRGPQTPGELRGRTERLFSFEHLDDVQATLQRLMQREPALVTALPRQSGTKEIRYTHLLGDEPGSTSTATVEELGAYSPRGKGAEDLEARIAELESEVAELKRQFAEFRKQFE